jgi:asparagine synthetase B (glutamine-hydrolysing)
VFLSREWLAPPVDWEDPKRGLEISREDVVVLLGRGTPRRFRTLYSNISRLPPGFALSLSEEGRPCPVRTWSAMDAGASYLQLGLDERASELRERLLASLRRDTRGKRVGLLLSGGYDSTLLATLMAQDGVDLRCYTVEAPGRYPSEWSHALETAQRLHLSIRKIVVTLSDLLKSTAAIQPWKRTPNLCWVIANQLAASQAAAEDRCDILLQGTGSDELFGPATGEIETIWKFDQTREATGEAQAWSILLGERSSERTNLLYKGGISPFDADQLRALFPELDTSALLEEDIVELYRELHTQFPDSPYESLTLQLELEMRSSDVIMNELATASQVHGMPVAFPFYDRPIVELAAGTPLTVKAHRTSDKEKLLSDGTFNWSNVVNKYLLRYTFKDLIPDIVNKRPRLAYTLPFSWWMRGDDRALLLKSIESSVIWETLGVNRKELSKFTEESLGTGDLWKAPLRFWLIYQLSIWEDGNNLRSSHRAHGSAKSLTETSMGVSAGEGP